MRKKASRTDGQTDRQTNRKQYPLFTGDNNVSYKFVVTACTPVTPDMKHVIKILFGDSVKF